MDIRIQGYEYDDKDNKIIPSSPIDFRAYEYDDNTSILIRYALQKSNTSGSFVDSIPQYFRITNEDFKIKEGITLDIKDIRVALQIASLEDLEDLNIVEQFITLYPYFRNHQDELVILWLRLHYPTKSEEELAHKLQEVKDILLRINRVRFPNVRKTIELIKKSEENAKEERENLEQKIKLWKNKMSELHKYEPEDSGPFNIHKVVIGLILNLPDGESLYDVFDSIRVSEEIPFVLLSYQSKKYFKVFPSIIPSDSWLTEEPPYEGIHFKISNTETMIVSENLNEYYSDGRWNESNRIEIDYNVEEGYDQEQIKQKLLGSLQGIKYDVDQEKQLAVKGSFVINDISLNKVIISDLITNDSLISYFLFLNETKDSITQISRYYFYYGPDHNENILNSITVLATPKVSTEKKKSSKWLKVLVKRASNVQEVESFRYVFSRLLKYYSDNYNTIFNLYKSIIPSTTTAPKMSPVQILKSYEKQSKATTEDQKTGKRLMMLANQRPEMFSKGYSTQCQPKNKQPYLISGDNEKSGKEKCKEFTKKYGKHKIINFPLGSDDYYACEPREPGEINDFVYPGVSLNKRTITKDKYPYLPCCFKLNQYNKGFGKYLEGYYGKEDAKKYKDKPCSTTKKEFNIKDDKRFSEMIKKDMGIEDEKKINLKRVLDAGKFIPQGRYGKLPSYFEQMMKKAKYEEIRFGTQIFYPILRLGVTESPSSFLHCLERAFNPKYVELSIEERKRTIGRRKKELIKMRKSNTGYSVAQQELYDKSDREVVKILSKEENYIDPDLFISLASKLYGCNIFLYVLDFKNIEGNIQLPNYSQAYLIPEHDLSKPSVFIMKREVGLIFPYQCELFVKIIPEGKKINKIKTTFRKDLLVKTAREYLQISNDVSAIIPKNLPGTSQVSIMDYPIISRKSKLMEDIEAQIIDGNGKMRVLVYPEVSLMISPNPPLDLPVTKNINITSVEKALEFIEEKGLILISQDRDLTTEDEIKGIWVMSDEIYYGYIIVEGKLLKGITIEEMQVTNPFFVEREFSQLNIMRRNRRIAEYLKEYTLFEYSRNPKKFGKNSFIVVRDYEYNIETLKKRLIPPKKNKVMYRDKKLIVTSKTIRNKLIYYLSTSLLNNREAVENYYKRVIISNYYKNAMDFKQNKNQIVFVDRSGILRWKQEEKRRKISNKISSSILYSLREPYFYRNSNIRQGSIALVQNVDDVDGKSLERAISVGKKWAEDQVNSGYFTEINSDSSKVSLEIFEPEGSVKSYHKKNLPKVYVLEYPKGNFSALLFFSK